MSAPQMMTTELFAKRLADLCLRSGMTGLPRDDANRHVLFTSMVAGFPADAPLEEQEVNARLASWIETSGIQGLDHITLRRCLVDAEYLVRRPDGSGYRVAATPPGRPQMDAGVAGLDLATVLQARREEVARRKAEYLAKAGT